MKATTETMIALGSVALIFAICLPSEPRSAPTPTPVPRLQPEAPALVVLWKSDTVRSFWLERNGGSNGITAGRDQYHFTNTAYTIGFYDTNGTPVPLHTFTP